MQAVLDTLAELAGRLCQAENVQIFLRDGEVYRLASHNGFSSEYQQYVRRHPIAPGRGTLVARTALTAATVHIRDALADPEYTWLEGRRLGGYRTMLGVPLLREGSCVGVMAMTRAAVLPFTPKQIELVENFADQAVIAIENVRLFDEVRRARASSRRRSSSRPQPPKCCRSSAARPANWSRCSRPCWRMRRGYARPVSERFSCSRDGLVEAAAMLGVPPAFAEFWQRGPTSTGSA